MSEADSPLDEGLLEDQAVEETLSKEDQLTNYMASLGFRSKPARAKDTLEYFHTYTDSEGRAGRVVAVIQRDKVGLEPESVAYFTLTSQAYLAPRAQEAQVKAPKFCRENILRILSYFDAKNERNEIEVIECALCGARVSDFQEHNGEQICLDCSKRKGLI